MAPQQTCSKCSRILTYEKTTPVDTPLTCSNGHAHVVARCPINACPDKRIAISAASKVGGVRFHAACTHDLVITSRNPTVLRKK